MQFSRTSLARLANAQNALEPIAYLLSIRRSLPPHFGA